MAQERIYDDLVAGVAKTITLSTPFTRIEIVKTSSDSATIYALPGNVGTAAVKGAECYCITGGQGAFDDQILSHSNSTTVSVIADANCSIYVGWKA